MIQKSLSHWLKILHLVIMRTDFLFFVPLGLSVTMTFGATYQRSSQLTGQSFLDAFNFEAISDPTHGRV
jgi:hypothetical protein